MFRVQRDGIAGANGNRRGPSAVVAGPCSGNEAVDHARAAQHECRGEGGRPAVALNAAQDAVKGGGAGQ